MPPSRAELLALLLAYESGDPDERTYRTRMLDLAAVAHDPFSRYEYEPGHFTASAFVVHPDGDRILLIHHGRLRIWVQPGGHIEPDDETLAGAAMREVTEETGITDLQAVSSGLVDIDIHDFPETADQPHHLHFDLRFGFVAPDDRLAALDGTLDARWVSADEVRSLSTSRSVIRPVERLLGANQSDLH